MVAALFLFEALSSICPKTNNKESSIILALFKNNFFVES